jgi:probable rRNA maturation factor
MRGITVYVRRKFKGIPCPVQTLKKLVRAVCRRFGITNLTVSITVVDDKLILDLNKKFLRHTYVTDCLAFDLSQPDGKHKWFELVVNGQRAKSEAIKRRHSQQAELALYVTHGLLHNLGFNDLRASEARKMHLFEDEILKQQGFGRVYDTKC